MAHTLGTVALTLGVVVFVVTAALGLAAFLLAARRLRQDPDRS